MNPPSRETPVPAGHNPRFVTLSAGTRKIIWSSGNSMLENVHQTAPGKGHDMEFLRILTRGKDNPSGESEVNEGFRYVYLIIALQVLFIFGMVAVFMVVGRIVATPWWVFLLVFGIATGGCIWIWRKIKKQFSRFKESLSTIDRSERNYEISVMGRLLTIRIEQPQGRLLEMRPPQRALEAPDEQDGTPPPQRREKVQTG